MVTMLLRVASDFQASRVKTTSFTWCRFEDRQNPVFGLTMPSPMVLVDVSDEQSWWLCRYRWQQISGAWFRIEDWQNSVFGLISLLAAHYQIHNMRNFFDGFFLI
ncbi:hypothetical protein BDB00DRAFT_249330 [Zychaea mexicana]|uniref:uncharacterized protein n=1 Tax=Zychaea mexicana TaxID=64656 RepID=UPI0022FDB5F4|nr:uncharacterized protein BDB00DRAFT_249330 [Zychaea mexicana]KAI9471384.1 hypothetical protein BDB00DRAFT_249330 [Zychaea mexicana]